MIPYIFILKKLSHQKFVFKSHQKEAFKFMKQALYLQAGLGQWVKKHKRSILTRFWVRKHLKPGQKTQHSQILKQNGKFSGNL